MTPGLYPVYEDSHTLPERHGEKCGGMIGIDCALQEGSPLAGKLENDHVLSI